MESATLEHYLRRRIDPERSVRELETYPKYFEIETINACNARCPMCTIEDWDRNAKIMSDSLFERIASDIGENAAKVRRVSLYRDGEPLMDRKMPARIARMKDGGVREVAISTNVSLLSKKLGEDILHAGLDMILLSIDSLDKTVFENIRVRLDFDEVLENALTFIDSRNRIRPRTQIWVRMIRQQSNWDEWPRFERYWRERLAPTDRVNFHTLHNWGSQLKGFAAVAPTYQPNLPCVALWSLMVIFANGDVPLCNVDYANKYPLGSVVGQSIGSLWQSPEMTRRRRLHMTGEKAEIKICDGCNVWDEPSDKQHVDPEFAQAVALAGE